MEDKWFYAVSVNDTSIMIECIFSGFDINKRDNIGHSAIHYATKMSNIELLLFLIKHGANINSRDLYGNTPIIIACSKGDVSISETLIKNGCDINIRNKKSNTALYYAIHENTEITQLLLENGADINIIDSDGETPLLTALKHEYSDIIALFLKRYTESVLKIMSSKKYNVIKKSLFMSNIERNIKMDVKNTICISDSIYNEYKNKMMIYSIGFVNN